MGVSLSRQILVAGVVGFGVAASLALWTARQRRLGSGSIEDTKNLVDSQKPQQIYQPTDSHPYDSEPPAKGPEKTPEQIEWTKALVQAAGRGELMEVRRLLGCTPSGPEDFKEPLIDAQVQYGTAHPNVTACYAAAMKGHSEVLEALLHAGANPNLLSIKSTFWDGAFTLTEEQTPLSIASKEGFLDCVRVLLDCQRTEANACCKSEYLEGDVEWGEDDDGTVTQYFSALDQAKQPEILALLRERGGETLSVGNEVKPIRLKVSSGSRMNA